MYCSKLLAVIVNLRLLVRERIDQRFAFDVAGRQFGQATRPGRYRAGSIAGTFRTHGCQFSTAEAVRLGLRNFRVRALGHQAERRQRRNFCKSSHDVYAPGIQFRN